MKTVRRKRTRYSSAILLAFVVSIFSVNGATRAAPAALPPGVPLLPASLVRTFDTSNAAWNPSAPDPAGIDYWPPTGGLLISDNMLWKGKVADPPPDDAWTQGVVELTRRIKSDADFVSTLLPLRDGVMISYRVR